MGLIAKNKVWFILLLTVIFTACTTQKKKGEATKFQKFYQNTTTEFNYYFNAEVLLEEAIVKLDESHQDNFNKFLPVYKYVATENPTAAAGGLDDAIKKVTVAKTLHPESHWLDDCYLLAGKAQYVKQDYESAEETLIFVSREYSPEAMEEKAKKSKKAASKGKKKKKKKKKRRKKKKKKKRKKSSKKKSSNKKKATPKSDTAKKSKKATDGEEKPDKYLIKHRPAHQEGLLWLARTYIERDAFEEAEVLINQLDKDPKTFKDIRKQLAPVKAHFHMTQKNYEAAVAPLEEAVASHKKGEKARYAYILAQIHDWAGRGEQAFAYYEKAMKASRSYDMEFSSRLNLAQNGYKSGKTTSDETLKILRKMSKDIKNEEYRDQIYYAMANISMKAGDRDLAIGYLKQSLLYSTGNAAQKAESYLQLAQYYYDSEDFVNAKNYYDSTLIVLPKTDDRYDSVNRYSNNLTDIAANLEIINLQDSLLMVAAMSDSDKKALAKKIRKQEEEDRRKALLATNVKTEGKGGGRKAPNTRAGINRTGRPGGAAFVKSTFPFYDDRTKKKGARDFEKKWGGNRKLEDNWRRSNRQGLGDLDETIADEEVIDFTLTDEEIARILKDIPNTPEKVAKANKQIEDAMFRLGILYRDRLQNNLKCVETLEELLKRYSSTEHEEEALYHLYLAYTDLGDAGKAKICYDKLVDKYGDGTFARVISDPNFLDQMKKEEKKLTIYYNETYDEFNDGKYQSAYDRTTKVNTMFGTKNIYKAKFALLSAMCLGSIEGKEAYIKGLKEVVAKYPDTPEQTRAKEILRLLGDPTAKAKKPNEEKKEGGSQFKMDGKKLHYFIVALTGDGDIKLSDAKNAASDYNREYHKLDKLRISNVYLDTNNGTPVLVIRRFKTKEKAMAYYNGITSNADDFLPKDVNYVMYPITQYNYRLILKQKSLDGYQEFFEENYK